ncbi:HMCN2-like protein [Mya arenaria]|uniref:HMCN2-like protein n=1 Tax=Mya arenaria TaxID=6604 RepID=A0ABY7E7K4_MYAAR|nr:HMCN2-like protein [Mya arenaria]
MMDGGPLYSTHTVPSYYIARKLKVRHVPVHCSAPSQVQNGVAYHPYVYNEQLVFAELGWSVILGGQTFAKELDFGQQFESPWESPDNSHRHTQNFCHWLPKCENQQNLNKNALYLLESLQGPTTTPLLSITLSGNGTSGGFTVQENSSLKLTCSSSTDLSYATFAVRELKLLKIITAVGYGPSGCVMDPQLSYLSCSCVSKREYVCVIRNVTRDMNGNVWFCFPPGGDTNDNSGDKTIVVTIGITAVSMISPAGSSVSVIDNTARQFRCETSAGNPQAIVEWYKDNGTLDRADDTRITTGTETDTRASRTLIVTIGKLTLTVQRNDHEVGVYCRANNGGDWVYSSNEPSTPTVSYNGSEVTSPVRVISGRSMRLTCSSTGNPSPTYTWTYPGGGSFTWPTLTMASVQSTHAGTVTCTARNTLSPTEGSAVDRNPPSSPSCTISGTSISGTATLVEGADRTFTCTSSAYPTPITYTWSTPGRGQVTGASLTLTNVQHTADQGKYTLTATNAMDPTEGNMETGTNNTTFYVDVQYEPSTPNVSYKGFEVSSPLRVKSGRSMTLNCRSTGNPSPAFTWTYSGIGSQEGPNLTLTNVETQHSGNVTCAARNKLSPTGETTEDKIRLTSIILQILYPPSTPACTINATTISTTAVLIEGTDNNITCTSSAYPNLITFTWSTPGRGPVSGASLSLTNVKHPADQGQYNLTVTNTMNPTRENSETGTNNTVFSVDVQFEPSTPIVSYKGSPISSNVRVISGRSMTLNCDSTGNPSPSYKWTYPGGGPDSSPTLTLNNVQTTHNGNATCTALNTLSPTGGSTMVRTRQATVNPPTAPVCAINATNISISAVLLEGSDGTITCTSSAIPPEITYIWSTPGRGSVSGANLSLTKVQHSSDLGNYTLTVTNIMDPTKGNMITVGPKVNLPQTFDILEGTDLNYSCLFTPGNPSQTSFVWTSSDEIRQWNSQIVKISSVKKSDDGMYTCTATNQMTPTGSPAITGNHNKSVVRDFHVTEHIGTFNVTQTEHSNATFTCTVDSNPSASINIQKDGEIRRSVNHSKYLDYTIVKLTCLDAGLYTCDGSNKFNNETPSKKDLRLFVTCTPRRPPGEDIKLNFTARQHENATLHYTVFAYPVPSPSQFVWKRCLSSTKCTNLSNLSTKTEIITIGLSSNLTILNIDKDDYGLYRISIDNGIGEELVEVMYLQPAGPPDSPTDFYVIGESIGETQAILTWAPGLNNGFRQTFKISYGILNGLSNIINVNVSDDELAEKMNYTINKLEPGKQYYVELFASNAEGNSMTVNATFTTLVYIVSKLFSYIFHCILEIQPYVYT